MTPAALAWTVSARAATTRVHQAGTAVGWALASERGKQALKRDESRIKNHL